MQRFLGVALANTDKPEVVRTCHTEYLEAGAEVITTNSYSCVPSALGLKLKSGEDSWAMTANSIAAATSRASEARDAHVKKAGIAPAAIRVAGCVPPLHESYRFDCVGDESELTNAYQKIVSEVSKGSDLLLCETMSSVREARSAATAADASGLPIWVSWTLHEDGSGRLRSSETIAEAVDALADIKGLEACLLNCCSHESICAAIPLLKIKLEQRGSATCRIGAYANGFETVHKTTDAGDAKAVEAEYQKDLTPALYLEQAKEYTRLGATIVGGCCGVFPEHIKEMSDLQKAGW
jgi:S-methylmethionine-dependent homocysteine/selenocysteine methylase